MNKYEGFTVRFKGVDVFFVTARKYATKNLAREICRALNVDETPEKISAVVKAVRPATAEVREKDLEIRGDGFGGYGNFWSEYEQRGVKPLYFIDRSG